MKLTGIILAAGKGTRMGSQSGSEIPKVMFEANGKPLIGYCVDNLRRSGVENIVVVVGYMKEKVAEYLDGEVEYAEQSVQLGTGHAVMAARDVSKGKGDAVLTCYGDMPLFKVETIQKLIDIYEKEKPTIAMLSVEFDDPVFWAFGRIIRDEKGEVLGSVEQKDCDEKQLRIKESNPCFYIFDSSWLWSNIDKISSDNAQNEFYLTDLIGMAKDQGKRIVAIKVSEENEALGVNTPEQLKQAEEILEKRAKDYAHI